MLPVVEGQLLSIRITFESFLLQHLIYTYHRFYHQLNSHSRNFKVKRITAIAVEIHLYNTFEYQIDNLMMMTIYRSCKVELTIGNLQGIGSLVFPFDLVLNVKYLSRQPREILVAPQNYR